MNAIKLLSAVFAAIFALLGLVCFVISCCGYQWANVEPTDLITPCFSIATLCTSIVAFVQATKESGQNAKYAYLLPFVSELRKQYEILMETNSVDNQIAFDCYKRFFNNKIGMINLLFPNTTKLEEVKWWMDEFKQIDQHYVTNPDLEFCDKSITWWPHITGLIKELNEMMMK